MVNTRGTVRREEASPLRAAGGSRPGVGAEVGAHKGQTAQGIYSSGRRVVSPFVFALG